MKISVLIIAHNESTHIAQCIDSIITQSCIPDEIICIVHNSTDETANIARKYPQVQVMEFSSMEIGPLYARIYGFDQVTGDIVACIDGDSIASINWLMNITRPLKTNPRIVATGGFVYLIDNPVGQLVAHIFFLSGLPVLRTIFHFYFWGANFACKKEAYTQCGGLGPLIIIQKEIGLHYSAEDCYLGLALSGIGMVQYVSNARVSTYPGSFYQNDTLRGVHQRSDRKKLLQFFHKYPQI